MTSNQKPVVWLTREPILHRWLLTRPAVVLLVVLEIALLLTEFILGLLATSLSRLSVGAFILGRYVGQGSRALNLWSTKEGER